MTTIPGNPTVDRQTWIEARKQLLDEEKEHTRARQELARRRRALPWLRVDDYQLTGEHGPVTLRELFGGHPQLVVYHFMFGADWDEGCPICSFWADNFDGSPFHLANRDTAFACVSTADIDRILRYKRRMGWSFPWVSAAGSTFNHDLGASHTDEQQADDAAYNFGSSAPMGPESAGLSTFITDGDGDIYLTYQTFGRGLESFNTTYGILDLTPLGRHEDGLPYPAAWVERHPDRSA